MRVRVIMNMNGLLHRRGCGNTNVRHTACDQRKRQTSGQNISQQTDHPGMLANGRITGNNRRIPSGDENQQQEGREHHQMDHPEQDVGAAGSKRHHAD